MIGYLIIRNFLLVETLIPYWAGARGDNLVFNSVKDLIQNMDLIKRGFKSQLQNIRAARIKWLINLKRNKMNSIIDMQKQTWTQSKEIETSQSIQHFGSKEPINNQTKSRESRWSKKSKLNMRDLIGRTNG